MTVAGHLQIPVTIPSRKEPSVPIRYDAGWTPEVRITVKRKILCNCSIVEPIT
jgi:hypothetical protein